MTKQNKFKVGARASGLTKNLFAVGAVAVALGACASPAKAAPLFYEGFNYPTGTLTGNTNPSSGTTWTGSPYSTTVSSPGLTYSSGGNTLVSTGGDAGGYLAFYGGNGLGTNINTSNDTTPDVFYLSLLMNNGSQGNYNTDFNFNLSNGGAGNANNSNVAIRYISGTWNVTVNGYGGNVGTSTNTTSLGVFKFDLTNDGTVSFTSYIDPTLGTVPATPSGTGSSTGSGGHPVGLGEDTISGIGLGGGYFQSLAPVDEIRIGSTYADVTPIAGAVPEPSTWAMMFGGLLSLLGIRRLRSKLS